MTAHASKTSTSVLPSLNRHARRREKVFGFGNPRPMSRNIKLRIMALARVLMRPTQPRKHYGQLTAKYLMVLQALLWQFHNAHTGLCFPSLETIAAKAGCSRRTVAAAIQALEHAGLLTWVHRLKRIHDGSRIRVLRTSNGYRFTEPADVQRSECKLVSRTEGQVLLSLVPPPLPTPTAMDAGLEAALRRLGSAIRTGAGRA